MGLRTTRTSVRVVRDLTVDYVYDSTLGGIQEGIISFSLLRETNGTSFSRHDFRLTAQAQSFHQR